MLNNISISVSIYSNSNLLYLALFIILQAIHGIYSSFSTALLSLFLIFCLASTTSPNVPLPNIS